MAFGFGFNKQKTLSSAEKYVQQGKISNAISEYEKVVKADPKDLTVINTIGDLYSRLGEADKATECFKTVGDAYATQGFTVKAIAMYKKISKLKPSLESVLKLAELFTQQGLFNDARSQYLQVAEEFLKANELDNAVRIFQKILEMDPDNTAMRVRLAEVYVRLGKKTEAWQIFSAAAETLRAKGSLSASDEVLQRMLTLDPGNSYALLMQGRNLLQGGDAAGALEALQKVSDLDSNRDGLGDLFKAYLKTERLSDAGTLARKLLKVHNDLAPISTFADALMQAGQYENALQVYDEHSDRLLAEDPDRVVKNLHAIIGHVRENPSSLERLLELFQKAGESTHVNEVIELLAHASVQSGDLPKARDLYQKLATVEPGNPLHMNHYQQVVGQLGGPAADKLISVEEAAVIVDEMEATAPQVAQHYPDAVALAVRAALTDAELFISYNMPAKAMGPLLAALPQVPRDLRLNQRLAALHTRAERFAEAGVCCRTLQEVFSEAGYPEEATRYGELADRYEMRSAPAKAESAVAFAPVPLLQKPVARTAAAKGPGQFTIHAPAASAAQASGQASAHASAPWPAAPQPAAQEEEEEAEFAIVADQSMEAASRGEQPAENLAHAEHATAQDTESQEIRAREATTEEATAAPEAAQETEEIDLSSEWDDAITIDADEIPTAVADSGDSEAAVDSASADIRADEDRARLPAVDGSDTAEIVEEIRFYLDHGMPEQASSAFGKLESVTGDEGILQTLRSEIHEALHGASAVEEAPAPQVEDAQEFAIDEAVADFSIEDISAAVVDETAQPEISVDAVEEADIEPHTVPALGIAPEEVAEEVTVEALEPHADETAPVEAATLEAPVPEAAAEFSFDGDLQSTPAHIEAPVHDLEISPDSDSQSTAETLPAQRHEVLADLEPVGQAAATVFRTDEGAAGQAHAEHIEVDQTDVEHALVEQAYVDEAYVDHAHADLEEAQPSALMGEFVADIEASLGEDFLKNAPMARYAAEPSEHVATESTVAFAEGSPAAVPVPAAASAAAASSGGAVSSPVSFPVSSPGFFPATAQITAPAPKQSAAAVVAPVNMTIPSIPAPTATPFGEEAGIDLAEMFGELKQDLESGANANDGDPETHYNLGIAFREMGLLDEAIGELQKTCQAVDRGHPFPHVMQTYTWLAQCFLDKGVPEAAIRWYDKALRAPGIDEDTRTALHYEIGTAYQAAGDKASAVKHLMEVYGRNIDYRDVAERIKALK